MARTIFEWAPVDLAAAVASRQPRLFVLSAPAGYRKNDFLRAFAAHVGPLVRCDLTTGDAADLARPVLDALIADDRARAARSAADRLGQRRDVGSRTSREGLRLEWPQAEEPQVFALRDVSATLASPAGAELFAELVAGLPAERTLALSTRSPLPPALQQVVSRTRAVSIGVAELALTPDAVAELVRAEGLPAEAGPLIYAASSGWPLVARLLARMLRNDSADDVLEATASLADSSLLTFAAHRVVARLDELVREALVVAMLLRGAGHLHLVRVLGDVCDDLTFARLTSLPFVGFDGERAFVHPVVADLLRTRFAPLVKSLYDRTLHVLSGDGAYVEAAHIAIDLGDVMRAAAIIDAAPPYTAAPVPLGEYERVIDRLDRSLITRFPNLWIATIPYRSFAVDRATFVREAETVYFCLPPSAGGDQRAAALMLLASAYINVGKMQDSAGLIEEALQGFAREEVPARSSLLSFSAWVHGMEGRFAQARSLAAEAARIGRDRFGENQTLHYIDVHEAAYRGQNRRIVVIIDELLRRLAGEQLPVHRAHTATNGALFTWANGDDASFWRYLGVLEDALTPGIERGFRPMIDAARGEPLQLEWEYPWPVIAAIAHLYRLGVARNEADALDAARAAAKAADAKGDPYTQILAHAALYVLDCDVRRHEAGILEALVASVESLEMRSAVRALLRNESAGILEAFIRRRVLRVRESESGAARLHVELLAGRVTRDGRVLRLSDKEFELVAVLGSAHGALSRDRIGEALWDHLDPEEWANNLKVTASRVRSKLAMADAILVADGRYRLSPAIEIDLRRIERVVREHAHARIDDAARAELRALLAAHRSGGASRYERFPWAQPLLARTNDLVCTAGSLLASDALEGRRYDEALAYAGEIVDLDPFNEVACEVTIRTLLARGDLDAARREFRRHATALANGLGARPSERLVELVRSSA